MARGSVTLLLNATYEPLCVVSARRAVVLVLSAKAVSVQDSGAAMHSVTATVPIPAVIRLMRYVRVPYLGRAPLSRRAVFARDSHKCVYCGTAATSIDHVLPRSRGGAHTWDNVVAACRRCNHAKADRTLAELGWRLRTNPQAPRGASWRLISQGITNATWQEWLDPAEAVSA